MDHLDHSMKALDLIPMLFNQFGRKDIGPKGIVFTERDLKFNRRRSMSLFLESSERVMIDVGTTLNALIQPAGAMSFFIDRDRECLSACDRLASDLLQSALHNIPQ